MKRKTNNVKKGRFFDGITSMLIAILAALTIRWLLIEAYVIPSGSMLPSLLIYDHIFVNKIAYGVRVPGTKNWLTRFSEPQRNEVVVFRYPRDESTYFIKRIIGVPGDEIRYEDNQLYINGTRIERSDPANPENFDWVSDEDLPGTKAAYEFFDEKLGSEKGHPTLLRRRQLHISWGPETVPEGHIFVMGDNRDNSNDSRHWGFVPLENLMGKAMFVWLSCEETLPLFTFLCHPGKIRWSRFSHWIE